MLWWWRVAKTDIWNLTASKIFFWRKLCLQYSNWRQPSYLFTFSSNYQSSWGLPFFSLVNFSNISQLLFPLSTREVVFEATTEDHHFFIQNVSGLIFLMGNIKCSSKWNEWFFQNQTKFFWVTVANLKTSGTPPGFVESKFDYKDFLLIKFLCFRVQWQLPVHSRPLKVFEDKIRGDSKFLVFFCLQNPESCLWRHNNKSWVFLIRVCPAVFFYWKPSGSQSRDVYFLKKSWIYRLVGLSDRKLEKNLLTAPRTCVKYFWSQKLLWWQFRKTFEFRLIHQSLWSHR